MHKILKGIENNILITHWTSNSI